MATGASVRAARVPRGIAASGPRAAVSATT
jgi:hypothetical protein